MRRLRLLATYTLIHTALPFQAAPQHTPQQTRRRTQRSATAADWRERCDAEGVVSYYDFGVRLHNEHAAAAPKQSATSSFAKALDEALRGDSTHLREELAVTVAARPGRPKEQKR